jgi:hypothetical protein
VSALVLSRYGFGYRFRVCGHPVRTATLISMPTPTDGDRRWCYTCETVRTVSVADG